MGFVETVGDAGGRIGTCLPRIGPVYQRVIVSAPSVWLLLAVLPGLLLPATTAADDGTLVRAADDAAFRRALAGAGPGHRIVLAPGKYRPGMYAAGLRGTAESPVVIEAADPADKPVFEG